MNITMFFSEMQSVSLEKKKCVLGTSTRCDAGQLMLLPCLHAACKPCLDQQTDQHNQGRLLCPCGAEVDSEVDQLLEDHVRRNEAAYDVSRSNKNKCTMHEDHEDRDAVTYCQDCDDYLCSDCQDTHGKRKKNKAHKLIGVEDTVPIQTWLKEMTCDEHPGNKLDLFDAHCKKPICVICSHGEHQHHEKEDIKRVFERKTSLLQKIQKNHRSHLEHIRVRIHDFEDHQTALVTTEETLVSSVADVHEHVARQFHQRQKLLFEEVELTLEGPNQAVQEKLKTVHAAEKSVISTIDYIDRVKQSTRKAELIRLVGHIEKKSAEDLKMELPSDDSRDTKIRVSFQGQKALEEIIDTFGSLVTCLRTDQLPDTQPTITGDVTSSSFCYYTSIRIVLESLYFMRLYLVEILISTSLLLVSAIILRIVWYTCTCMVVYLTVKLSLVGTCIVLFRSTTGDESSDRKHELSYRNSGKR